MKHGEVVFGAFFITGRNPTKLLEPIHEALNQVAGTVEGAIERTRPVFIDFVRNRCANAMPTQIGANAPIAIAFVSDQALGAAFGLSSDGPLDTGLHEGFKHDALMALSSRQDEGEGLAMALRPDVDLGTEPALTTTQSFWLGATALGSSGMLMCSDQSAIDIVDGPIQVAVLVGLLLECGQNPLPAPGLSPPIEAAGNARPLAIPVRHIPPGRTRAIHPQHAIDHDPMVEVGMSRMRFLWRQEGL